MLGLNTLTSLLKWLVGCGVAGAVAAGATHWVMSERLNTTFAHVGELEKEVSVTENQLLGYTRYTSFLTLGKQTLGGQAKLITASVVREEGITQIVEKSALGFSSTGTVAIWHTTEYSFGFDLRPGQFDVRATPSGIEVSVPKPTLLTAPAVTHLRYKVLVGGLFTDEKAAVLKLYEAAAQRAAEQGKAMATELAALALCEKKLIEFLRDLLAQQPGVKVVPTISAVYR